jgi:hypothetical protein
MNKILFKNFGETTLNNAFDCITIYSLQDYYDTCSQPNKIECSDDIIEPDEEILNALKVVLSHYMTVHDYEKWLNEIKISNGE